MAEVCDCPVCQGAVREYGRHPKDLDGKFFGDKHWPLPLPHERGYNMAQLYMLIDVTTVEGTQVLLVGNMHRVQMWGRLYKSQGKKVLAPPLEGRGFSKLDKLPLQYLFWHHCKRTPPEDYAELVLQCLTQLKFIKPDEHPIEDLERQVAALKPEVGATESKPKKERAIKDPNAPIEAPKKTSTTGLVWVLADELIVKHGRMPTRQEVLAACSEEGINPATASTQFSKWKGSKNIVNA